MSDEVTTRKLLVETEDGHLLRLTVPKKAKITFSNINPGQGNSYKGSELCLRIYENQQLQLAAIPGVRKFRDVDNLKLEEAHVDSSGNLVWVEDDGSSFFTKQGLKVFARRKGE